MPLRIDLDERETSPGEQEGPFRDQDQTGRRSDLLLFEQGRLRADVDRLLQAQTASDDRLRSQTAEGKAPSKDEAKGEEGRPNEQSGEKAPADSNGSPQPGKEGEENNGKGAAEGKTDPPKEPILKRVTAWMKSHPIATVAIPILLVAVLVGGWFFWGYLQSYESTDDAQIDGHVNAISSRISGTVVSVHIENNQDVRRGEVAVELDPRDYEVALSQQKGNLAQAQANVSAQNPNLPITQLTQKTGVSSADLDVTSAKAGAQGQEEQVQSALADLKQAEANAANAASEEVRYRMLVEKAEVSRESYQQKLADSLAQTANVASRRAAADAARKTVDQRTAALQQAVARANETRQNSVRQVAVQRATSEARVAAAVISQAQLDQAVLNLTYCRIYAPVAGVIGNKTVEVGTQVSIGQELFDISPTDDIWITANFKETQLRKMHPGQSVTISVDALQQKFQGYVEDMPGATGARYSLLPPENATGNYVKVVQRLPVRIRIKPNQAGSEVLRIGMSVEPKVMLK